MSYENKDLNDFPAFGRILESLARDKGIGSPLSIAKALYNDDKCKVLVRPTHRKKRDKINFQQRNQDIDTIRRTVQNHLSEASAYNVQSKYLLSYSILFDCSLDYLYGVTDIKSSDNDIRDICNKLHLNENAVKNLIDDYDSDPEVFSCTRFWSDFLSSDVFIRIPYAWLSYRMAALDCQDLEKKIQAISNAESEVKDEVQRGLMQNRHDALEEMTGWEVNRCEGEYSKLLNLFSSYIDSKTKEWLDLEHEEYEESYYDNEIKKIDFVKTELNEGRNIKKRRNK